MPTAAARKLSPLPDPTFYPVDDDMGEGVLHQLIASLFQVLARRYLAEAGRRAFVGANTFIYWVQFHAEITVAPDVYVMDGISPDAAPDNWKLWENGVVPAFVLEVVSKYPKKDYKTVHEKYAAMGVRELVIFDPKAGRPRSKRVRWQIYRRVAKRGFVRVEVTNGDRVQSRALRCWLRAIGEGEAMRVRIASGPAGETVFPTSEERMNAEAARAQAEAARAQAEAARADTERRARLDAEAEVERLRAALAARDAKPRRRG